MSGSSFLYPHLAAPPSPSGALAESAFSELVDAARTSWNVGVALDAATLRANDSDLDRAAALIVQATSTGNQILALGNGGSACDADRFVRLLGSWVHARSLLDPAVLSALANDVGASRMFGRQVETFAVVGDVVAGFTTSGTSANVLAALGAARRVGATTIAFAGYGGASLQQNPDVDVCLHVDSSSVHRIQEAQGALCGELVRRVHAAMSEGLAS